MKEILSRNRYSEKVINQKLFDFLCDPEKPPKPEISFTLCISYTSKQVEFTLRDLINRMKTFIPEFHVRFAYKSIKIGTTFIKHLKRPISKLNSCNCVYQFICPCSKSYVGRTKRVLQIRAQEHRTFSRAKKTYNHLQRCPSGAAPPMLKNYLNMKKIISSQSQELTLKPKSGTNSLWAVF